MLIQNILKKLRKPTVIAFILGLLIGAVLNNNKHIFQKKIPNAFNQISASIYGVIDNYQINKLRERFPLKGEHAHPKLFSPTDIVYFQGKYVAAEVLTNKLAIFDDLQFNNLRHFDPQSIGESLQSPHFLAVTPWNTLLITNGWGNSIVEIEDLEGKGWKSFSGPADDPLHYPHGICVDKNGWIYVGDSKNSRVVRFRDMKGLNWEVFRDVDKVIAYSRQLVCSNGDLWVSNSYENLPNLNTGTGANILKIMRFDSGKVQIIKSFPHTNLTGILPLGTAYVIWAEWATNRRVMIGYQDDSKTAYPVVPRHEFGVPYGMTIINQEILLTFFGDFTENHPSGIISIGP